MSIKYYEFESFVRRCEKCGTEIGSYHHELFFVNIHNPDHFGLLCETCRSGEHTVFTANPYPEHSGRIRVVTYS